MKPTKVEFLTFPKIKPITQYKRCLWTLFLLKCSYPRYRLLEDMQARITFDDGVVIVVTVKKGYVCDLASIPRPFWSIYPPDGAYRYTAILHDMLYQAELFERIVCDEIFKLAMHEDVPEQVVEIFYHAVRGGGYFVWKGHTEETKAEAKKYLHVKVEK